MSSISAVAAARPQATAPARPAQRSEEARETPAQEAAERSSAPGKGARVDTSA
jgi:hypothetical protein